MDNLKKGRKNKRKVGDKNVDPTPIAKQNLSPTKKIAASSEADDTRDLFCDICKVAFNDKSKKDKHMAVLHKCQKTKVEKKVVISNDKPKEFHPCSSCQERFESKTQLKKHTQKVHKKSKQSVKSKPDSKGASVQSKALSRPPPGPPGPSVAKVIQGPVEEEEEGKDFFCEECGVEFDRRQQLVQHMKSEHDEDITSGVTTTKAAPSSEADSDEEDLEPELEEYVPINMRGQGHIFMDGFEVAEEIVNSDNEEISQLSSGFARLAPNPRFPPRKNEVEFYEEDVSDEEMESQENSEDSDQFSSDDEVMIESPKRAAEEITLDEDSDEEIVVEKVRNEQYEKELYEISQYEKFLSLEERAFNILTNDNNEDKVKIIQEKAWFAKPRNWKPASPWETWNATVKQICAHYKLIDFRLNDNQMFSSYDAFSDYVTGPMKDINQKMDDVMLYKWKKAKWLQTLDPVIPDHMKILEETLDDDDE